MKIVSVSEMKRLERETDAAGNSYADMMEKAGSQIAEVVLLSQASVTESATERGGLVVVLVGPGNNGGDGLVAARHLATRGVDVRVHLARERDADDANWAKVRDMGITYAVGTGEQALAELRQWLSAAGVVVDALLGTGVKPPLSGEVAGLLEVLRERLAAPAPAGLRWPALPQLPPARPLVVAADVPSGLDADTGAVDALTPPADVTVSMGLPKRGLLLGSAPDFVGDLALADIGLQGTAEGEADLLDAEMAAAALPARPGGGHKGTFGSALVVGGSVNYVGAALLCAAAASRAGAGLVGLASLAPVLMSADALTPEAVRLVLPGEGGVISEDAVAIVRGALDRYDALLLGPGMTQEKAAARFVEAMVFGRTTAEHAGIGFVGSARSGESTAPSRASVPHAAIGFVGVARSAEAAAEAKLPPLVIDADGLNALPGIHDWQTRLPAGTVLTPHPGEMARLLGSDVAEVQKDRIGTASAAAKQWRAVVVLKGAGTVVADPDGGVVVAPFANPALASGGTGDVLSGAIVGLLAQGLAPVAAARLGVYLHGVAGELARREIGASGVVAGDLLSRLPRAQQLLRGGWR